jgi:ubiquinone/menaquinone biosynthesis C-methylase UbiE
MTTIQQSTDPYQAAFQNAFRSELYELVDSLPFPERGMVVDVPCGDGFYTVRLARRATVNHKLFAVDASPRLCHAVDEKTPDGHVEILVADAYRLPFEDRSVDLIWCAQSLISLEPDRAVGEIFRVCKPDGIVAILEADQYHHILLPWPAELEVALNSAVFEASVHKYGDGTKLAPARRLRTILRRAGFRVVKRTQTLFERTAPFDEPTREFLVRHFEFLRTFAGPFLSGTMRRRFEDYADPSSAQSLLNSPDAELECANVVYTSRKA